MVVVVILSILAAVVVPRIMDNPDKARVVKAKQDIRVIKNQMDLYRLHNFRYPTTEQGMEALVQKPADAPHWQEGGYLDKLPKDPGQAVSIPQPRPARRYRHLLAGRRRPTGRRGRGRRSRQLESG